MKLGVVFPQTEIEHSPAAIRDYAQAAEDLGYDYLLAYEHVLGANPERPGGWRGPYTHLHSFFEPFVLFSYLAGLTHRLQFTTGILILPQRQTVLVAKQAATLDALSGGRLRLGIGIGWNAIEYEALGEDFHTRGRRIEEQVELLRLLWTEPLVSFQGREHILSDAGIKPLPVQRPIPIWFGGSSDPVLRRMARLGDGWMPNPLPVDRGQTAGGDAARLSVHRGPRSGRVSDRRARQPEQHAPGGVAPLRHRLARAGRDAHLRQHDGRGLQHHPGAHRRAPAL